MLPKKIKQYIAKLLLRQYDMSYRDKKHIPFICAGIEVLHKIRLDEKTDKDTSLRDK